MFKLFQTAISALPMTAAKAELERDPSIKLIDVRNQSEYQEGHIPRSILLPLDMADEIENIVPDKTAKLFVYCHSGARSNRACDIFSKLGYTDVTNIGGITAWTGKITKGGN